MDPNTLATSHNSLANAWGFRFGVVAVQVSAQLHGCVLRIGERPEQPLHKNQIKERDDTHTANKNRCHHREVVIIITEVMIILEVTTEIHI